MNLKDFHSFCPTNSPSDAPSAWHIVVLYSSKDSFVFMRAGTTHLYDYMGAEWSKVHRDRQRWFLWYRIIHKGPTSALYIGLTLESIKRCLLVCVYSQPAGGSCPSPRCSERSPGSLCVSWPLPPEPEPGCPSSGWPPLRTELAYCSRPSRGTSSPHAGSDKNRR